MCCNIKELKRIHWSHHSCSQILQTGLWWSSPSRKGGRRSAAWMAHTRRDRSSWADRLAGGGETDRVDRGSDSQWKAEIPELLTLKLLLPVDYQPGGKQNVLKIRCSLSIYTYWLYPPGGPWRWGNHSSVCAVCCAGLVQRCGQTVGGALDHPTPRGPAVYWKATIPTKTSVNIDESMAIFFFFWIFVGKKNGAHWHTCIH